MIFRLGRWDPNRNCHPRGDKLKPRGEAILGNLGRLLGGKGNVSWR
jgi:hypothetical protein